MKDHKANLIAKIRDRSAVVGYVGLPFAVEKAKLGFRVIGVEQNPARAAKVNRGENYIGDVRVGKLGTRKLIRSERRWWPPVQGRRYVVERISSEKDRLAQSTGSGVGRMESRMHASRSDPHKHAINSLR
ncbi:hypothetical protein H5T53_00545 [Candidatus Bipolaricaulota bacterium]|nr:hypothetical protein [Candidatus Bipolaricaulota bacterium]